MKIIQTQNRIVQDIDLYLDVDCEANYVEDERLWVQRVWLDKETGKTVIGDVILFSANNNDGLHEASEIPPDISTKLTESIMKAINETITPKRISLSLPE